MSVVRAAVANLVEDGEEDGVLEGTLVHEKMATGSIWCSLDLV